VRLVQSVRSGDLRLDDNPVPTPGPTQVLVRTRASLISAGTEKSMRSLASASLVAKARARPDLVREVINRARTSGIRSTVGAVRSRLGEDMPLGYSAAGEVVAVGESVAQIRPGARVATAGAPHADFQVVASNLTAVMPEEVSYEHAAFATVGSIALNGIRLAEIGPGSRVAVVGLGLVGQLTARLAAASGCLVAGIEPDPWKREMANSAGTTTFSADTDGWERVAEWSGGEGLDAVVVTAATKSSEPLARAADAARDRGVLVVVGDVGMELDRRPFYERELTLRVARSYGPGRYDPSYEDLGIDYPPGHVRWTAQRNMAAFLQLVAAGKIDVSDLITHRFAFSDALSAYEMLADGDDPYVGIVLGYEDSGPNGATERQKTTHTGAPETMNSGLVGAGQFARSVLVPAAEAAGFTLTTVASATGAGAQRLASDNPGISAVTDVGSITVEGQAGVVFIATRHDTHAALAIDALNAGKHVFCEKPLALSEDQLDDVETAWAASAGALMVGFNRRWAPAVSDARKSLGGGGPLQIIYRVNAGALADDHWLLDRRMGGRLLGEACHFVDTCSALAGDDPSSVTTITSGTGELLLDQDFTLLLGYPDGSQASIVYAAHSSQRPGKERIEILGRGQSLVIDDFHRLDMFGPRGKDVTRYKPADKGHTRELEVFAEIVRGTRDGTEVAQTSFRTSRVMFAAVESAMTGTSARPTY